MPASVASGGSAPPPLQAGRKFYDGVEAGGQAGLVRTGAPSGPRVAAGAPPSPGTLPVAPHVANNGKQSPHPQTAPPSLHHSREILALNVGGRRFLTLYETLIRFRSSYFERLVALHQQSGKIFRYDSHIIDDGTGAIFINRDGDLFAYVLQFLRDGKNAVLPEDISLLHQIRREAEFFGLEPLREMTENRLSVLEQRKEEWNDSLASIRATVSSISQSLYVTNFSVRN